MKKKILTLTLMAVAFAAVTVTVVSCKDSDFEYQIQQQLDENSTLDEALKAQVATLEQLLQSVQAEQSVMQGVLDGNQTDIATAQAAIGVLEDAMDAINEALEANGFESMNNLAAEVVGIMQAYEDLKDQVMENKDDISGLSSTVETLSNQLVEIGDIVADQSTTITQLLTDTKYATELAKADSVRIDALEGSMQAVSEDLDEVKGEIESIKQQAEDNLKAAEEYADEVVEALKGDFTYETLGDFEKAVNDALADLPELKEELETLAGRVDALEDELDELTDTVNKILSDIDAIANYLAKQVTSILVQATVNPVFGTFSMPMSINSNVLAAFYGKVTDDDLKFPTASQKYYADIDNGPFLTSADLNMLGVSEAAVDVTSNGVIFNEKEGNAGTLYVTVNPNTVDFSGLTFGMENSIQEESKVELGALAPSDYKITFGYTRANNEVSNGFYEAPATLKTENINENIDMGVAVEDLKNLMNDLTSYINGNSLNMTNILTSMYQDMSSVLDADAIYAQWTDDADEPQTHRTYSQYCIAATAVKPLSYSFMIDANYETFPGIGRIESIIDKLFESIEIPTFDLSKYHLEEIEHVSYNDDLISFDAKIRVSSADLTPGETIYIYASNGTVIGEGTWDGVSEYVDISIKLEISQSEIYGEPIDDINAVIDAINNALDDINSVLADLDKINNIASSMDDLEAQLLHYVDRLNEMLCNIINSVNTTLQPILLVNTTDGFAKLSQMRSSPSVLSSGNNIQLLPTSFTAEILAPPYKKLVGVTNVYSISDLSVNAQDGDSTCKSLLDAANNSSSQLAAVIDGDVKNLSMSNLQTGYIYEIVFSAVDYSGKVVAEKFYVRVAE